MKPIKVYKTDPNYGLGLKPDPCIASILRLYAVKETHTNTLGWFKRACISHVDTGVVPTAFYAFLQDLFFKLDQENLQQ